MKTGSEDRDHGSERSTIIEPESCQNQWDNGEGGKSLSISLSLCACVYVLKDREVFKSSDGRWQVAEFTCLFTCYQVETLSVM
jgi:hypothetical protein